MPEAVLYYNHTERPYTPKIKGRRQDQHAKLDETRCETFEKTGFRPRNTRLSW